MTAAATATQRSGLTHIQLYAESPTAPIRWRLLGGNNRELGRGVRPFDNVECCVRGIEDLRLQLDELESSVRRTGASTWAWRLTHGDESVAVSAHRYDRLIRCKQGLANFVDQVAVCEIGLVVMLTGTRRWGSASLTVPGRGIDEPRGRL